MDTKKLRQKILDLAIRGKLVPQDPNDEPASVLLERIRAEKERLIKEGKIKRSKKSTSDTPHYENRQVGEANEVPFEVPESWEWTTVEDVTVNRDSERIPLSLAVRKKQQNKIYDYYGAAGVIDKVENYLFDERLLLVGEDGANLLSRSKDNAFFAEGKYWVNNHAHVLDCPSKSVLDYIAFVINSMSLEDYITGSAQPKLTQDNLNKILIPLPPEKEQHRIIESVNNFFSYISFLEGEIEEMDSFILKAKSNILDLAIHGKLVSQDPNDEPAIELLKRINPQFTPCDNAHDTNQLPDSWCWTTLGDVCELVTGSTPSKLHPEYYGGDFPFYKPSDLDAGRHVTIPSEFLTDAGKGVSRIIPVGATAICCIGSIGKCGFIEKEGTTNQQINTAVPSNSLNPLYLYYFCNSSYFIDELSADSSAITISIVNKSKLSKMLISLPPYNEQQRIVIKIEELFAVLDEIQKSIEA